PHSNQNNTTQPHHKPNTPITQYNLNTKYEEAENGLEIIKRIKAEKPETNIIVLSAQENFNVILEAIKEYDCNYVQKDKEAFSNIEQLIKAIFNRKKTTAFESGN